MDAFEGASFDIMPELLLEYENNYMDEDNELEKILSQIDYENVVQEVITTPAVPSVLPTPRFARVEEQRIGELFDARHSTNTKRNTSWAFKIFNGMLLRSIFVSNKYIHFAIESTDAYRLKSHDTTPYRDTVSLCLS